MTTQRDHPYWGIERVELHEARRHARAERAKVVRELFAGLLWWRHKAVHLSAPEADLKVAHQH
jgi:hypothetical protein